MIRNTKYFVFRVVFNHLTKKSPMRKMQQFLLPLFFISVICLSAQDKEYRFKDGKEEILSFLETHYSDNDPGFSLALLKGDELILQYSAGLANLDRKLEITENTPFYLASLGKTFTALSVLMLVREGKLRLEDKISIYFPDLPVCAKEIRVYHLLNHTSGLPDYYEAFGDNLPRPLHNKNILDLVSKLDSIDFEPGVRYAYTNTAYILLSEIISQVSGMSYGAFIKENIFDPLQMNASFVFESEKALPELLALGYSPSEDGTFHPDFYQDTYTTGPGGIFSTTADLVKWYRAIRDNTLISERFKQLMWHFPFTYQGKQSWMAMAWTNETFGRRTPDLEGLPVLGALGVLKGYRTAFFVFPEHDFGFILLCNGGEFPFLSYEIAKVFFELNP